MKNAECRNEIRSAAACPSTSLGVLGLSKGGAPSVFTKPSAFCLLSSAFTLVELMVVLAVIALLVMLLVPNLRRAFQRAETTSCKNNLHQFGVAMGRYMSDHKGYFIYPGEGGQDVLYSSTPGAYSKTAIPGGEHARSGDWTTDSSRAEDVENFIVDYLPEQITLRSLDAGKQSVRICPSILREIKAAGNYFDDKSPNFKGYRIETVDQGENQMADWEELEGDGGRDADENVVLDHYFTTYAINLYSPGVSNVYRADRKNISNKTIAFIDWNAREGWRGEITHTNWMFNNTARGIVQDTPKRTDAWWVTEVGFHHKDGTNAYANYVAMDGSVGSVSSNEITLDYFTAAGP